MISSDHHSNSTDTSLKSGPLSDESRILLESACVDLIGEFEQMLEAARSEREAGFLGESMLLGKKMLLTLVEFVDGYLEAEKLRNAVDLLTEGCALADAGIKLSSSQSFGAVKRVFGRRPATDVEVADAHRSLGTAIANALSVALNSAVQILGEARMTEDINDSLKPMLAELRGKW
ncbi:MAG: hypothetical protein AAFX06_13140 [Planctomycetota bacterium]